MARYALLAVLALLAAATTTYAADADEQAISKIEHEWTEAIKAQNKAVLEKYLSEDFTYTDEDGGFAKDRSVYIDQAMKMPKVLDIAMSDEAVRVHGTTAVATGRLSGKDQKGTSFATRYTDTFAKSADGWKAIASQETKTKIDGDAASASKAPAPSSPGQPAGKRIY